MDNSKLSFEKWLINNDDLIKYYTIDLCNELGFNADFIGYFSIDAFKTYNNGDSPQFKTINHILISGGFNEIIFYFKLNSTNESLLKIRVRKTDAYPLLIYSIAEIQERLQHLDSFKITKKDFIKAQELLIEFKEKRNQYSQ